MVDITIDTSNKHLDTIKAQINSGLSPKVTISTRGLLYQQVFEIQGLIFSYPPNLVSYPRGQRRLSWRRLRQS